MKTLRDFQAGSPYQAYAYAYPHKTAYGPLAPPVPLDRAWHFEPTDALFLYFHIPFCEMRCGFCNLFTQSHSRSGLSLAIENTYLDALERQSEAYCRALPECRFERMAVGGGTPTFLSPAGLSRLFSIARNMGAPLGKIPLSVEASPFTVIQDRLEVLSEYGVTRLSLGVESFLDDENAAAGRAQMRCEVDAALERIRAANFSCVNLDLIYGLPGQTEATWMQSVEAALVWSPEELYLYPLYVRPLTGLSRREHRIETGVEWDDLRLACYRAARRRLLDAGYEQKSMRLFSKDLTGGGPRYCCQEDGMTGLGCGARSYTRELHYSTEYAVGGSGVGGILKDYVSRSVEDLGQIYWGFRLDHVEQRRRYLLKSILRTEGMALGAYRRFFGTDAMEDLPMLNELIDTGWAQLEGKSLAPTPKGLENSDVIGAWLVSEGVRERMSAFELR